VVRNGLNPDGTSQVLKALLYAENSESPSLLAHMEPVGIHQESLAVIFNQDVETPVILVK